MPAKFKRAGLHRLECPMCPCYGYFTVAMLEQLGEMPGCFGRDCDETLQPARLELALLLGLDDAPVMAEYNARVNSVAKGQASHYALGRELESPEYRALYGDPKDPKRDPGLLAEHRARSRARRIAAILPAPEPLPF